MLQSMLISAPDLLARATDLRNDVEHCHAPRTMREWPSTFSVANTYLEVMARA